MLDKKIYERYLLKVNERQLEDKDLDGLNNDVMNIMIQFYIDKQYDELRKELVSAKRFKKMFEEQVTSYLSYQIGCFSMIIKVFEILVKNNIRKDDFKKQMTALYAKAGVKEILEYIYKNPDSQHKVICERTKVKNKSYLSQLLKQLENIGCVERYSGGKTSFFSLSIDGQVFVKEKQKNEKTVEPVFPIGKYNISCLNNPEKDSMDIHVVKNNNILWEKKYEKYNMEVNCVGKN